MRKNLDPRFREDMFRIEDFGFKKIYSCHSRIPQGYLGSIMECWKMGLDAFSVLCCGIMDSKYSAERSFGMTKRGVFIYSFQ